jgi:hypothetical protein
MKTELNHQYAGHFLVLGGLLGMASGVVALWLRRGWQVIALSVVVGVALVAVFDLRNAPPDFRWESLCGNALTMGGIGGVLLGAMLLVAHLRIGRCT